MVTPNLLRLRHSAGDRIPMPASKQSRFKAFRILHQPRQAQTFPKCSADCPTHCKGSARLSWACEAGCSARSCNNGGTGLNVTLRRRRTGPTRIHGTQGTMGCGHLSAEEHCASPCERCDRHCLDYLRVAEVVQPELERHKGKNGETESERRIERERERTSSD